MAPALVLSGAWVGCVVTSAFSAWPGRPPAPPTGVAAALVNSSNQIGGSLGAALLNTIAATAAASYLAGHAPHTSPLAATVHGDITAFTFLTALFAAGAVVVMALLYLRAAPPGHRFRPVAQPPKRARHGPTEHPHEPRSC